MESDVELVASIGSASRRRFVLTMIVAVLLTGGMSLVYWLAAKRAEADADRVSHTYAVRQELETTMRRLTDVESGARGFSLTGDERFLQQVTAGRDILREDLASLRQLTADNPAQQRELGVLEPQIDNAIRFVEATVAARQRTGEVSDPRAINENNRVVSATRATVRRMQAEEDSLAIERSRESSAARQSMTLVAIGGVMVGLVLLVTIGFATHREIRATVLNTELERRIDQRTAALRAERDERMKAEERLRLAVTGAHLGTWHWDLVTGELEWSPECLALFGLPRQTTVTYERFLASVRDADRARVDEAVKTSLANRTEYNVELRAIWPDGSEHDLVSIGRGYYDGDGRAVRMEGVALDVTERKRASDALEKQAIELSERAALLDEAYDPVLVWNLDDSRITYCNRAVERLYGFTRGEAIGRIIQDLLVTAFPEGDGKAKAALREHGRWEGTLVQAAKDGRRIVADTRMAVFAAESGRVHVLEANRDVTEQTLAQEALRASESRFRQLAEATPAMIWQAAPDGTFTYVNQRLHDYVRCDTLGSDDWRDAIHPDDRPRIEPFRQEARAACRLTSGEFRVRRHDGDYRWFYVQKAPVVNRDGSAAYWIGTATDIDELKRAEQALVDVNQRKDEFLATLAHELRNPLAPIRFALQSLKSDATPEIAAHAREVIDRQVTQLVRLVEDLLDVSRITTSKIRLRLEPVRLAGLIEAAADAAAPLASAAEHRFRVDLPAADVWITGDATRLIQVFSNVLNNAVKFTPRGGHISFSAEISPHEALVRVVDSGIGIAADALPRLFEMFHQEGRILERSTGGLGIGLTLAHRLIEMHHGRIEVRSDGIGRGTVVEITLPTTPAKQAAPDRTERPAARSPARALRVAVVDDNVDAAEMLAVLVSGLGHTVKLAYDGPSAVQLAASFAPDVILLDIGLPIMNGYEVAQELRRRPPLRHIYLAALTGWGQAEDRRRAREAGFDTHFTKPVSPAAVEDLLAAVAQGEQFAAPRTRVGDSIV